MPIELILTIAVLAAAFSAVNGILGAIFLGIGWMWLYGGVVPMLRNNPQYTWSPHLLLPLILFLVIWQARWRGKIGPQVGLLDVIRGFMRRRSSSV